MDLFWKQFEALATASGNNVFLWARFKLTALYVLIVAIIIFGFSIFLYQSIGRNLKDASEDDFAGTGSRQHFVQTTLSQVEGELLLADLVILLASAGASYVLAGYTLRPIQRSLEAQKAFSENASHELRTPLAVMKNDMEVLLRHPNPKREAIQATLQSNIEEIDRMTLMAKDLLLLARSERRAAVRFERVSVSEVAANMTNKMRPLAEAKSVVLSSALEEPIDIQGDAAALEHMLLNLLQNAIEHTSAEGSVQVGLERQQSEAVLTISDTGSGIDPKDLPHLFERFYKGEGATGTGLGLSIVHELVVLHGGSISITSVKGEGTEVRVRLPLFV